MNSFLLLCDVFSFIFWKKLKTPKKNLSKLPDLYLRQNSKVKTLTRPETKKETNWHIGKILIQHKFFDSETRLTAIVGSKIVVTTPIFLQLLNEFFIVNKGLALVSQLPTLV